MRTETYTKRLYKLVDKLDELGGQAALLKDIDDEKKVHAAALLNDVAVGVDALASMLNAA